MNHYYISISDVPAACRIVRKPCKRLSRFTVCCDYGIENIKGTFSGGKMKIKFLTVLSIAIALFISACGGKSDADLQKAVTDKLAADRVVGVTAAVKDGVATLSGEVADITVKTKAEASAKVEGIKSVANNITLKALPTPAPVAADPMLRGKVEANLTKAGCTGATVDISNGVVTLSGTVPGAKFAECVKVVNESGAGRLDNKLVRGK